MTQGRQGSQLEISWEKVKDPIVEAVHSDSFILIRLDPKICPVRDIGSGHDFRQWSDIFGSEYTEINVKTPKGYIEAYNALARTGGADVFGRVFVESNGYVLRHDDFHLAPYQDGEKNRKSGRLLEQMLKEEHCYSYSKATQKHPQGLKFIHTNMMRFMPIELSKEHQKKLKAYVNGKRDELPKFLHMNYGTSGKTGRDVIVRLPSKLLTRVQCENVVMNGNASIFASLQAYKKDLKKPMTFKNDQEFHFIEIDPTAGKSALLFNKPIERALKTYKAKDSILPFPPEENHQNFRVNFNPKVYSDLGSGPINSIS